MVNILAYAEDLVLLAPSWRALQLLLDKLYSIANHLDMICNSSKTVWSSTQNGAVIWFLISFQILWLIMLLFNLSTSLNT